MLTARSDQAAEKGIDLSEHLAPARTTGDPKLIESLIANLIDNATRHNHPGGHIHVSTETTGPWTSIAVTNTGPRVPEDQLQRLFEPFERLSPDHHDGHGLGLAIINAVAQAHHAAVTANAHPEGGLVITVRFPTEPATGT